MNTYDVTTSMMIEVSMVVRVSARHREEAIDNAAALMPLNGEAGNNAKWSAVVKLTPPPGVEVRTSRAVHFAQASGADKAKLVQASVGMDG